MADKRPEHNAECHSDDHTKHLCYFVSYGYQVDDPEEYKDLVKEPRFLCHFCGRTAHCKESLCQPMPL